MVLLNRMGGGIPSLTTAVAGAAASVPPVVVVVVVAVAVLPFTPVVVVVVADAAPSVDWTGSTFDTLSVSSFPTVAT